MWNIYDAKISMPFHLSPDFWDTGLQCGTECHFASHSDSNNPVRRRLVRYWRGVYASIWRQQGYTARVTDRDGNVSEVSNLFVVHAPPLGYQWAPPGGRLKKASIQIKVDGETEKLDFNKIQSHMMMDGEVKIELKDGSQLSGAYAPYTHTTTDGDSVPFRARLYGIQVIAEGQIKVFELSISDVRSIEFLSWQDTKSK